MTASDGSDGKCRSWSLPKESGRCLRPAWSQNCCTNPGRWYSGSGCCLLPANRPPNRFRRIPPTVSCLSHTAGRGLRFPYPVFRPWPHIRRVSAAPWYRSSTAAASLFRFPATKSDYLRPPTHVYVYDPGFADYSSRRALKFPAESPPSTGRRWYPPNIVRPKP